MQLQVKYHSEIKTVPMGDGTMVIENLTPILSPKERERRKKKWRTGFTACLASTLKIRFVSK